MPPWMRASEADLEAGAACLRRTHAGFRPGYVFTTRRGRTGYHLDDRAGDGTRGGAPAPRERAAALPEAPRPGSRPRSQSPRERGRRPRRRGRRPRRPRARRPRRRRRREPRLRLGGPLPASPSSLSRTARRRRRPAVPAGRFPRKPALGLPPLRAARRQGRPRRRLQERRRRRQVRRLPSPWPPKRAGGRKRARRPLAPTQSVSSAVERPPRERFSSSSRLQDDRPRRGPRHSSPRRTRHAVVVST